MNANMDDGETDMELLGGSDDDADEECCEEATREREGLGVEAAVGALFCARRRC